MDRGEDKERVVEEAMRQAMSHEKDQNTIWTDGSRLCEGKGVGIAWYEEVREGEEEGKIDVGRRAVYGIGGTGKTGGTRCGRRGAEHMH